MHMYLRIPIAGAQLRYKHPKKTSECPVPALAAHGPCASMGGWVLGVCTGEWERREGKGRKVCREWVRGLVLVLLWWW
jgi:hypothetical protein